MKITKWFGSLLMVTLIALLSSSVAFAQFRARTTTAQTPDQPGLFQVQPIYATALKGPDQHRDTDGEIVLSLFDVQYDLSNKLGGFEPRIATHNWMPDVTFVQLSGTQAHYAACGVRAEECVEAENNLLQLGYNLPAKQRPAYQANKLFHIYGELTNPVSCGDGRAPGTMGNTSVLFLDGTPPNSIPCNQNPFATSITQKPGYPEVATEHELGHGVQVKQPGDADYCGNGHSNNQYSVMFGQTCSTAPWEYMSNVGLFIDPDYTPERERWLQSELMQPTPANAYMPLDWPMVVLPNLGVANMQTAAPMLPFNAVEIGVLNGLQNGHAIQIMWKGSETTWYVMCRTTAYYACTTSTPDSIINNLDEFKFNGWTNIPYFAVDQVTGQAVAQFISTDGITRWAAVLTQ